MVVAEINRSLLGDERLGAVLACPSDYRAHLLAGLVLSYLPYFRTECVVLAVCGTTESRKSTTPSYHRYENGGQRGRKRYDIGLNEN
jgi:hypothetical protein